MSPELPVGYQWRRPGRADVESIFAVIARHNMPLVGTPDITLADVGDELSEPGFDPSTDARLVRDDAGVEVAYGLAFRKGTSEMIDIDVYAHDAVAGWLWDQVLTRARALGAAAGHDVITVDIAIHQNDEAQRSRARARSFAPVTNFQRMRITSTHHRPSRQSPPGSSCAPGRATRRSVGTPTTSRHGRSSITSAMWRPWRCSRRLADEG